MVTSLQRLFILVLASLVLSAYAPLGHNDPNMVETPYPAPARYPGYAPPPVPEQQARSTDKPLIIVRFNQLDISYDQPLYSAVKQAFDINPNVQFDVLAVIPVAGIVSWDARWEAIAKRHTQDVVDAMRKIGVPSSRITTRQQNSPVVTNVEIQIFVH